MARHLWHGVAVTAAAAFLSLGAMAQDRPAREARQEARQEGRPAARAGGGIPEERINRLIQDANLTAEQAAKVKQVLDTFRQSVDNWQKENAQALKEAQEKMAAARQSGNQEDMKAAREAMAKATEGRRELVENAKKQLLEVPLTQEQVDRIGAALGGPMAGPPPAMRFVMLLNQLNLTAEQIEKIKKDVLTEEQRKKLEELEKRAAAGQPGVRPAGEGGPRRGGEGTAPRNGERIRARRAGGDAGGAGGATGESPSQE